MTTSSCPFMQVSKIQIIMNNLLDGYTYECGNYFLQGTENVGWLHLDYNLLSYIPPKLINPMKKLVKFSVSHNNLLHVNELFYIIRPRVSSYFLSNYSKLKVYWQWKQFFFRINHLILFNVVNNKKKIMFDYIIL